MLKPGSNACGSISLHGKAVTGTLIIDLLQIWISLQIAPENMVAPHSYAAAFAFDTVWITNTGPAGHQAAGSVQ